MRVLVACEYSGRVRDAFIAAGHDAMSCDLKPSEQPGPHYQGDVRNILKDGWDLMIAHPECTYLAYSGMRYWNLPGREEKRREAMSFFMEMINAPIPRICVENPRGLPGREYRRADQEIHPWYFGDPYMKRTCLWLKNLPKLTWWEHDNLFGPRDCTDLPEPVYVTQRANGVKLRHFTEAAHSKTDRSRTFPGIARAMAQQWSELPALALSR